MESDILKPYQGGVFFYTADKLDQIKDAFMEYQNNNDTKAAMILAFAFQSGQVRSIWQRRRWFELTPLIQQIVIVTSLFYDAPTQPVGVFDNFLAIQPAQGNASTISYAKYILEANEVASPVSTRLVIHDPGGGKRTDAIPNT